jgi:hypothetical protein
MRRGGKIADIPPAADLPMRFTLLLLLVPLGAKAAEPFWSFRPVTDPKPPAVRDAAWPLNPIDRFVLKELESRGLRPVVPADKRTLIRRATYDLTGLPPTPEEIDAFLNDSSPGAFATVVDRLLASPAYGERWGRHWLDVVRYADTAGDNSDYPIPQMYRYRNWVIRAIGRDMPYDQFVREQLAGDLMPSRGQVERYDRLIATGYLANARRFGSYEDARYPWHLTIEDTIDNFGRAFLGLTVNCCRCHDHKFDPLSQEDYYALYGFFSSMRYPWPGIELDKAQHDLVPLLPPERAAAIEKELADKVAGFDAKLKQIEKDRVEANREIKEAEKLADEAKRKSRIAELNKRLDALKADQKKTQDEKEKVLKRPMPYDTAYAVAELKPGGKKKAGNACVQLKGDPEHLGKEVPRHFPTVLGGQTLPASENGSGRLELANWLTNRSNPLFARVMVNRIWHFHFGKGIVPTPGDFGKQGLPPTHRELLDWLAKRFVESGWSLKAMHRLIMLSRTYQMSSREDESNAQVDVGNEYLWRFNRRRLDAESIRDTLLKVSGALDCGPGGAHPFPDASTWNFTQHNPFKAVYDHNKRSVYLMQQRIARHPYLGLFDGADTNSSTAKRLNSTTLLQALYLMNDPFVHGLTRKFAARLLAEGSDDSARIERAFQLLFARPPSEEERAMVREYLARVRPTQRAWESVTRALWMSNEFVYVD